MALAPGSRLGTYEIIGLLGAGGMGEVYRATDTNLNRQVAIKVLPELYASDPGSRGALSSRSEPNPATDRRNADSMPDGENLVGVLVGTGAQLGLAATDSQIAVVLNWFDEVRQRAPRK